MIPRFKRKVFRFLFWLVIIAVAALAACIALLIAFQSKLIYHPQPYRSDYQRLIPPRGVELEYTTSSGKQTAFYVPARAADDVTSVPYRLWVLFGGNGSLALFWAGTVQQARDDNAAFLLVDYPGFGKCEGCASPKSIDESSEALLSALASRLHCPTTDLERDLNVAGHSLGAAVALQFAARHPIKRAVLVSPFTSMAAMARLVVGGPLSRVLRHNYDNQAPLAELAGRTSPPRVTILHGDADTIIPIRMSRELLEAQRNMVHLVEVPGADHVTILDHVLPHLSP